MIDDLVIEMRQSQSLLDHGSPLGQILQNIGNTSSDISDATNLKIEESIAKPIATLCTQLHQLVNIIGERNNNDDKEIRKELMLKVSEIDQRLQAVPTGLKHIIARLVNLDSAISNISSTFEDLKSEQTKLENMPSKKWGFFGLGNKN